jgi:hypothetical protein
MISMIQESMTVTQALVELKTLDSRITKTITNGNFIAAVQDKTCSTPIATIESQITASYQKAMDLIERYNAIKKAIVTSNATTQVTVGDKTYTVAEAIDAKNHAMVYKAQLLQRIANQTTTAQRTYNELTAKVEKQASDLVKRMGDENGQSETSLAIYDQYMERNKITLVDPLGTKELMEKLSEEMDTFALNVDTALSVVNATTVIEIQYGN